MNILDALWGGTIRPRERSMEYGGEYYKLYRSKRAKRDRFLSMLTPEAKEAYDAFCETDVELTEISDKDLFIKGFRLGVQFFLAAVSEYRSPLPQDEEED